MPSASAPLIFRAMGKPELAIDPRFASTAARAENREALRALLGAWLARFADLEIAERALAAAGVTATRVHSTAEALRLPEVETRGIERGLDDRGGGTVPVSDAPWRFLDAEAGVHGVAPYRGEHNRDVLRQLLGFDDERIDALEAAGVLSPRVPGPRS